MARISFRRLRARVTELDGVEQTTVHVECLTSARSVDLVEVTPEGGPSEVEQKRELALSYQLVDADAGIDRESPLELTYFARNSYDVVRVVPHGPSVVTERDG